MNQCPNFNDYRWKYLVKTKGELEAYKYWHQNNGSLASVELSRGELLEAAKEYKDELSFPIYKGMFDTNPAQFLKEMSEQLHSSPGEVKTAEEVLGPNLSKIALELYPTGNEKLKSKNLDPSDYNIIDSDQKQFAAQQSILANENKEPILTNTTNNNPTISLEGNRQDIINKLFFDTYKEDYKKFFLDNLYTHKENPSTTEIVNNASRLALTMERPDLLNMGRLIYKYLHKNPSLSIRILNEMDQSDAKAYFNRASNNITFAKDTIGIGTIEFEIMITLHEMLHGLTFQPWFKQRNQIPLTPEEQTFKKVVEGYYNYFKSLKGASRDSHPFSNPEEFLMGALMDHNFKRHLQSISENKAEESPFIRFMKDLLKGFLKLFGINSDNRIVDKINPAKFEQNMFDALSDYLKKMDRIELYNGLKEEDNRNYGLSFAVTTEGDYETERQKIKGRFTPNLTNEVKRTIEKSLLSIKSFGSTIRGRFPESQEGFQAIFKQLKKLEDPDYNLDQIDFFFDFTSEIAAMMNMVDNKITKLYNDESNNDIDFKLKEYEDIISSIRNFDPIIKDIEGVKVKMEISNLKTAALAIDEMLLKRSRIERIYSMGIFPLVTNKLVDILEPASKKAIEIANENLTKLNESLTTATKYNAQARIKQLQKQIKKEQIAIEKEYTLNGDKIESWLRGEMGDSNTYSTWLQAAISNSNPVISGLHKFIRDNIGEIAPKVLELDNTFQSQVEAYAKDTGRSINTINGFNMPLIQTHKEVSGKDESGNLTYRDVHSLLHAFNGNHITELQNIKVKLNDLYTQKREIENDPNFDQEKLNKVLSDIDAVRKERRQFMKDYMEQRYAPEVHDALDMLYDDLGGYNVWDYMGPLLASIEDVETAIDQENDENKITELFGQLDDLNFELTRLSSLYEKSPGTSEYTVAEHLKKRRELLGKYSTFQLTEKGARTFQSERARIERKFKNGEITPQVYERWLEDNTVTELSPKYWERKKEILKNLNEIGSQLGARDKDTEDSFKKLYSAMEDITKPYRTNEGIINGLEISDQEIKDIKANEQEIEDIKENIESFNGLTKRDKIDLSNLYEQRQELIEKQVFSFNDPTLELIVNRELDRVNVQIQDIEQKKKIVNSKLMQEYLKWIKKLQELDERKDTQFYAEAIIEQRAKFRANVVDVPNKFVDAGITYIKNGDSWVQLVGGQMKSVETEVAENKYKDQKAEIDLHASQWWKDNHITKTVFKSNLNHNPSDPKSFSGEWQEEEDPIYAWRQTRPRDQKYLMPEQPSIKYKKRVIKDEYVNKNYRESVSGDVQPKLIGAKDDKYINKEYLRLTTSTNTSDVATAKYLKFLTDTYLKAQEAVPIPRRKGYELPSIRKSTIERLFSQPLGKSTQETFGRLGNMLRLWNDDVLKNEQDKDVLFGYNDDFNGIVPMKFLGEIDSKDISVDLAHSILAFTIESMKRDQLIKSLPFANAIRDIVNNPDYKPVQTKEGAVQTIKRKFLPKGTELAKRVGVSNTALQINEMIKTEIYGEKMKDAPGAKLVNNTLAIGAKVMLGFNFTSSIQNYANAFTQSIMESESKRSGNFTMKNFFEAQKIYYAHMHELMADLGKYGNKSYINQFFDYFGGINFKLYGKNNKNLAVGKVREFVSSLSVPNQITEHMLNYHMGIAIGLNYRVKAIVDGKETTIPIFDAFTKNGSKFETKPGVIVSEVDRKEMISKLNSSSRRINGEYGDSILADKYVLGKLSLFMNRYVIPFVTKRYGSRKFNIQDGVRDEGYWKLFGKIILRDLKSKAIPILMGWKYYTKEEKTAIMKSMTEFGFTIMFFLMLKALGGDDNKKLKNNSLLANDMIYALKGIQQQNEAFMPVPGVGFDDLFRKIQNPFPILGKIKNLVNLIQDGSHALYYEMGLPGVDKNDVFYSQKTGWHQPGDLKVMSDVEKLIGLPQRLMQYLYPEQAIRSMDTMSRIK